MELLLMILFWLAVIVGGLIALPFVFAFAVLAFCLAAFVAIAIFLGSIITIISIGAYFADLSRPVISWFRRTAGCK